MLITSSQKHKRRVCFGSKKSLAPKYFYKFHRWILKGSLPLPPPTKLLSKLCKFIYWQCKSCVSTFLLISSTVDSVADCRKLYDHKLWGRGRSVRSTLGQLYDFLKQVTFQPNKDIYGRGYVLECEKLVLISLLQVYYKCYIFMCYTWRGCLSFAFVCLFLFVEWTVCLTKTDKTWERKIETTVENQRNSEKS